MTLHFGGQDAAFVWAAYALTAPVLIALVAESLLRARRWRKAAEALETARDRSAIDP